LWTEIKVSMTSSINHFLHFFGKYDSAFIECEDYDRCYTLSFVSNILNVNFPCHKLVVELEVVVVALEVV
jgi:hypothetical protein